MKYYLTPVFLVCFTFNLRAQEDPSRLTIDRIFTPGEFQQDYQRPINWIEGGESYITVESNASGNTELIEYKTASQARSVFISAVQLTPEGADNPIPVEDFSMSDDETRVLIFTNSQRVWRSNTRGDYWVFDIATNQLSQIGKDFPASSLMFAKFSKDNQYVAYVVDFNLYREDFTTGEVIQLTDDGTGDIINGTFDWVYEEEFGCRDGFRWNNDGTKIAYWQLDASTIGTFNMINNTDSIYSQMVPVQYPKVGRDPSSARVGIVDTQSGETTWVQLEGSMVQNYLPGIQWVSEDELLIQQINRKQNHLKIWAYRLSSRELRLVYEEREETWVDILYPDISTSFWGNNDLKLVDDNQSFIRMKEDDWRNAYKVEIATGKTTMLSPGTYDVASIAGTSQKALYYVASPDNNTRRYLYSVDLKGRQKAKLITPEAFTGINTYNISPNGQYAIHYTESVLQPTKVNLISLPDHQLIKTLVSNEEFTNKLQGLALPTVEFFEITTPEGIKVDARVVKPVGFEESGRYPVIFHVYGEPWGQQATDSWIGLINVMLAQNGYVVIDIDNRGTPCLKGSEWRKSIYRNIGRINILDMGQAATEILKFPYLDQNRVGVWGWSGGGSSTLNLMFQFPGVFQTGVAVAFVANQLTYDNIYQERYMGLPQENEEDFLLGSPITHAKNLEGNLLLIHGTADDNVHYQNMELLVNELIRQNKQFQMMAYPNRSHGIREGENTRRHLFSLITNYFFENVPPDE